MHDVVVWLLAAAIALVSTVITVAAFRRSRRMDRLLSRPDLRWEDLPGGIRGPVRGELRVFEARFASFRERAELDRPPILVFDSAAIMKLECRKPLGTGVTVVRRHGRAELDRTPEGRIVIRSSNARLDFLPREADLDILVAELRSSGWSD